MTRLIFSLALPSVLLCVVAPLLTSPARADSASAPPETFALHGQATLVAQGVGEFASPYAGDNSLEPQQARETLDVTLFAGVRPWRGGEIWINPEVDQGFGLSNTVGAAGFPSAEAYKVGNSNPYLRLQRLFFRQTINLGGERKQNASAPNQLGGAQDSNRLVLTVGKVSVVDVFDTNRYAHDPRGDFLNWAVVDTGTFDYAADAWGYSYGVVAEWYQADWTLRAGLFNLSKVPNGEALESDFSQRQFVSEIEHRHMIAGRAGAVRLTGFANRGLFSRFDDAVALARLRGRPIDAALTRRRMTRLGLAMNAEQEVTANFGLFLRVGTSDGEIEPYDFTDIDRTVAVGGALKGTGWGRSDDSLGLAVVANGISNAHKRFLAAGGIGVLVGDGRLPHPGDEQILETYYAWRASPAVTLTLDYQHIANPGYNRDRGPTNVFGVRLHGGF